MNKKSTSHCAKFLNVLIAAAILASCSEEPPPEEATEVVFVSVVREDVTVYRDYIGRTGPSERVLVNARVDGFLEAIEFVEGSTVTADTVLYRIDARPFETQVLRAEATLNSRRAQLAKFRRDVERIGPLYEEDAASLLDYDNALSSVEQAEAAVQEAEADLTQAQLELDYTQIRAPIDGVVGSTSFDVGAVIRASDSTPLTVVSTIDPLYVTYSMSALDYLNARRRALSSLEVQQVEREGSVLEGEVEITLPDDTRYQYKGRVAFTDPQVNPETGTFEVRAILPNPNRELLPGQYTRVSMPISVNAGALLVPEETIVVAQGGVYVMVILDNNRIERRLIVPGPIVTGRMIVENGVVEGERIVLHGINRIFHGSLTTPISLEEYEAELAAAEEAALESESLPQDAQQAQ
jgi:membrane fusion protein, multidrug efflux system